MVASVASLGEIFSGLFTFGENFGDLKFLRT
jgi:hypothetical protein